MDEDTKGEGGGGSWRLEGGEDAVDGAGEGEIEAVAGDTAALVKAVGLEMGNEGGVGLDKGFLV